MPKILSKFSWVVLLAVAAFLGWYVLMVAQVQQAGDIAEYYGVTESLINHGSVELKAEDQSNLESVLHKAYFSMPGYYIPGIDGERYPVHFWFYSLVAVPARLLLSLTEFDLRRSLYLVNLTSIVAAVGFIMARYLKSWEKRIALILIVFSSALMSFLLWPGPDLWYLSLLMIVPFAFFKKDYWLASTLAVLASWHSQPLMILSAGLIGYALWMSWTKKHGEHLVLQPNAEAVIAAAVLGMVALIPYVYNWMVFGVLTPWTQLQDGWTIINGFGVHNISLRKFYEQWFDLNVGLFWYAPVVFVAGLLGMWHNRKKFTISNWFFVSISFITALFYQTNPAWHYGTVGFGPGRHGIYLLPILIFFVLVLTKKKAWTLLLSIVIVVSQLWSLSLNGVLEPDYTKTLYLSPYAEFVLARWPGSYNPTPEIFVDRVNHTDTDYPTSAVFKVDGACVKAYVLLTDKALLDQECGGMPSEYEPLFDNPLLRISNLEREIVTTEATFWPQSDACADWFVKTENKPYECMHTEADVLVHTGLTEVQRLSKVPDFPYPGIWKVVWGKPIKLTVPAGYIVNHYALDGVYVTYPVE